MLSTWFIGLKAGSKPGAIAAFSGLIMTVLAIVAPSVSHAQAKLELDCLSLAASPLQQDLPPGISGRPYDQFDAVAALPVCEAAMAKEGQTASTRLVYAMGRTYQKLNRNVEAFATYKTREAANYPPILQNLGAMYDTGSGLPTNHELAFDYFQRAGKAGLVMVGPVHLPFSTSLTPQPA